MMLYGHCQVTECSQVKCITQNTDAVSGKKMCVCWVVCPNMQVKLNQQQLQINKKQICKMKTVVVVVVFGGASPFAVHRHLCF